MDFLLSAKGGDVTAWRAAADFTAAYRQTLLDRVVSDLSGSAETVFSETCAALDSAIATHRGLLQRLNSLITDVATMTSAASIRGLTVAFYDDLYRHFGHFRSAPAFYQLSMAYLQEAGAAIIAQATDQLGAEARHLPELALIAVGPAGRGEYSPCCPLQILLVHEDAAATQLQTINLFCQTLHAGFEEAGLPIDPEITPRNPDWRGTLTEWRQRCETEEESINLCRLIDQFPLHSGNRLGLELKQVSSSALRKNSFAVANLVKRMAALSNGLGLLGRLKLGQSGSKRGMFSLLDHGLLPLSAALSALALIRGSAAVGTCERISDLLKQHELDVELAERMLATWHCLHGLRLWREQSLLTGEHTDQALCLDPNELTVEQRQSLKEALESVAIIQRHVEIVFSGTGE
jgi:signal-transduction protein with cAMP-binding, CBS, and nucleotidyltransferase domain